MRLIRRLTHISFNRKVRRHSGRVFPDSTIKMPQKFLIDNCLEPQMFWDDWKDYRDGFRAWMKDKSKIRPYRTHHCESCDEIKKNNNKLRLLLKRREVMKNGPQQRINRF